MTGSRQAPLLNPLAAGFADLLDEIEGVQAWAKDRQGRYRWVNRGFLLNYALESAAQVIGRVLIHMRTHIAERLTNPELARRAMPEDRK